MWPTHLVFIRFIVCKMFFHHWFYVIFFVFHRIDPTDLLHSSPAPHFKTLNSIDINFIFKWSNNDLGGSPLPFHRKSQVLTWASMYMRYVVDNVELAPVFLWVQRSSLDHNIPPTLHNHFHLNITLIRRTSGRKLGTLKYAMLFRIWRGTEKKSNFTLFCARKTQCGENSFNSDQLRMPRFILC